MPDTGEFRHPLVARSFVVWSHNAIPTAQQRQRRGRRAALITDGA
ncbi:hypothetical protein [Streptomyces sp. NPDC053560]